MCMYISIYICIYINIYKYIIYINIYISIFIPFVIIAPNETFIIVHEFRDSYITSLAPSI